VIRGSASGSGSYETEKVRKINIVMVLEKVIEKEAFESVKVQQIFSYLKLSLCPSNPI
jgi:hypothetical protein